MNDINTRKLHCPTCGKVVLWNDDFPFRPFCSKRCQLIDFGEWAGEKHSIPGEPTPDADQNDEFE
ncbi:MAG: DNA gyrase inhibitor YacG [Porticoccaceae bacterium]